MGLGDFNQSNEELHSQSTKSTSRDYAQPTLEDFEEFLDSTGYKWQEDPDANAAEYVYDCHELAPDHSGVVLRVFSTIDQRTDKARGKGEDAIRLVVWNRHTHRPMTGYVKTLRIQTWRKNLEEKIHKAMSQGADAITTCEECGEYMVVRDGQYGKFYACTGYPNCENTENFDE